MAAVALELLSRPNGARHHRRAMTVAAVRRVAGFVHEVFADDAHDPSPSAAGLSAAVIFSAILSALTCFKVAEQ